MASDGVDYYASLSNNAQVCPLIIGPTRRIRVYDEVRVIGEVWGGVSLCFGVWVAVICLVFRVGPKEGYEWESSAQMGFVFCTEDVASF